MTIMIMIFPMKGQDNNSNNNHDVSKNDSDDINNRRDRAIIAQVTAGSKNIE